MTDPTITASITPAANTQAPTANQTAGGGMVDKNTFLKLLVAQVQHQDPTQPTDSTQWLSQMAQFSTVEQLTNMAQTTSDSASANKVAQAVALIGHQVTYTDASGSPVTGSVSQVDVGTSGPTLTVSGIDGIDPSTLTQVR